MLEVLDAAAEPFRRADVEAVRAGEVQTVELQEGKQLVARPPRDHGDLVHRTQPPQHVAAAGVVVEDGGGRVLDDRSERAVVVEEEGDLLAEPRDYFGAALECVRQSGGRRRLDGGRARRGGRCQLARNL